jgi:hypothetical protein
MTNTTMAKSLSTIIVLGALATLSGCAFPNRSAPGPSAIAVDSTANQVWLVDSGKVYRCSPSGDALACKEATTNIPR